jgi:NADPH2:quinone reductase
VLVAIELSAVNPTDVKARAGLTPRPIDEFQVPHVDGVGRVVEVGPGVGANRVGQRVWLWLAGVGSRWGTAAEYTVLDAAHAVPLPERASAELGSCLGVPAMTAYRCLLADGPIAGQVVLVHGGAGAVGHFAIELARWSGARVVATASTAEKASAAAAAGAELVVDYRAPDAAERIREAGPVDLILDVAVATNWDLDLGVLRKGGSVVSYATDGTALQITVRQAMTACARLRFYLLYADPRPELQAAAAGINAAIEADALTALPITRFGLAEAVQAHEAVERGTSGKVVLAVK